MKSPDRVHEIRMLVRFSRLARTQLGIVLIVGLILTISIRHLYFAIARLRSLPPKSYVSRYEQRFSDVKSFLRPNQIVIYTDDFTSSSEECDAFVLAQYSIAPTILATPHSPCGHLSDNTPGLFESGLLLENLHDPKTEPYLQFLFPQTFRTGSRLSASVDREFSHGEHLVLLKDSGLGVKLYARAAQ